MKKLLAYTVSALLAASLMAGCGESDESSSSDTAAETTTTTAAAEDSSVEEEEESEAEEEETEESEAEESEAEEEETDEGDTAMSGTVYMYTVQASWNGNTPADLEEGPVRFSYDDDGNQKTAKGACDLNQWDSGSIKYNGNWIQCNLASADISDLSMTFTVESTADTRWEYHAADSGETDQYEVLRVFDASICDYFTEYENIVVPDGTENMAVEGVYENTFTFEIDAETIQSAIDAGKAELVEYDGYAVLGFSFQCGHFINGLVTATVTSDNLLAAAYEDYAEES